LVGNNGGQRWLATWSRAAAKRRKGKGRKLYIALYKVRPGMGSGNDRR
jgi:hypothetical protein